MRTGKLGRTASPEEPPGRCEASNGVDCLIDERLGLTPERLLGQDGLAEELRQTARRTEPHLERVARVGTLVMTSRKMIGCRLVAEVEHKVA